MTALIVIGWILYGLIGFALWPWFARATYRWGAGVAENDKIDLAMSGILALIGAAVWPIIFVLAGIFWLIANPLRRFLFGREEWD